MVLTRFDFLLHAGFRIFHLPEKKPHVLFKALVNKHWLNTYCGCLQTKDRYLWDVCLPPLLTKITQPVFSLVTGNVTGKNHSRRASRQGPRQSNPCPSHSWSLQSGHGSVFACSSHCAFAGSLRVGALLGPVQALVSW